MTMLKIGNAHNEAGKRFFTSDYLTETSEGLFWKEALVLHTGNFSVGSGLTGDGTAAAPLEWQGLSARNSTGTVLATNAKAVRAGAGTTFAVADGTITVSVELSNFSSSSITLTGGGARLVLNGNWALQDGGAVKLASENTWTAYLYSLDPDHEYPVLKARSNRSNADLNYLLLDENEQIPLSARKIAGASEIGEVLVNGNQLSVDAASGLLAWTGFAAQNAAGSSLASTVKTLKAGDNITFAVSRNVLTISASASESVTVDSALSGTSVNPVQNKVVKAALDAKAALSHNHAIADVDGLQEALDNAGSSGGGTVDASRLLPVDPQNGDLPVFNATATVGGGNDGNTAALLHLTEVPLVDTAYGNAAPLALTTYGRAC